MKKTVLDNYKNKIVEKFSKSKENSNLYFYSKLKCTINTEEYLNKNWKKSFKNRQLSRLRASDHSLLIDTGRHKKVPQQQRLCKICSDIDDEFHFFLQCNSNVQLWNQS